MVGSPRNLEIESPRVGGGAVSTERRGGGRHYTASKYRDRHGRLQEHHRLRCRPQCARLRCVPFSDGRRATDTIYFEAVGARAGGACRAAPPHRHVGCCPSSSSVFAFSPASRARGGLLRPCAVHAALPLYAHALGGVLPLRCAAKLTFRVDRSPEVPIRAAALELVPGAGLNLDRKFRSSIVDFA